MEKKITLTLGQLLNQHFQNGLQRLMDAPLQFKSAYWLGRVAKVVDAELRNFQKARADVIKKLGKPKEDKPEVFEIDPKDQELVNQFIAEMNEVAKTEIELPISEPFTCPADIQLSTNEYLALSDILLPPAGVDFAAGEAENVVQMAPAANQ